MLQFLNRTPASSSFDCSVKSVLKIAGVYRLFGLDHGPVVSVSVRGKELYNYEQARTLNYGDIRVIFRRIEILDYAYFAIFLVISAAICIVIKIFAVHVPTEPGNHILLAFYRENCGRAGDSSVEVGARVKDATGRRSWPADNVNTLLCEIQN